MAREHARILCSIWSPGDDFRARTPGAQRLYFLILSQRELNNAGVIPLMVSKWARCSTSTTADDIETDLQELEQHRYLVVDRDTDEVLVRSFIRNDGIAKQPNMLKSALRYARQIESASLRSALAEELVRIGHRDTIETASVIDPGTHRATQDETPMRDIAEAITEPPATGVEEPSADPSSTSVEEGCGVGEGEGEGGTSSSRGGSGGGTRKRANPAPPPEPLRDPTNPRCAQHRDIPATDRGPNCRACAAVRREVEALPPVDAAAAERAARRDLIDRCPDCDETGMRDLGDVGVGRCTHPLLLEESRS